MVEDRGTAPNGARHLPQISRGEATHPTSAERVSWNAAFDTSIPDTLLPEQYFDRLAPRACDRPEKRLMFAVLLDAVIQLQRRNSAGATEAEIWVRGEAGDEGPFSFRNVCDALDLDAAYLAGGLLAWRATHATAARARVRHLRTTHRQVTPSLRRRRPAATT